MPLYYERGSGGYSAGWVRLAKQSMATVLAQFSAARMVDEYVDKFYAPAARQGARYLEGDADGAQRRCRLEGARARRVGRRDASGGSTSPRAR